MNDKLRRLLRLVRKTGDTMVVTDPDGDEMFVVMGVEQYEKIRNVSSHTPVTSKPDLIEAQIFEADDRKADPEIWETMQPAGEQGKTWDPTQMDERELAELEKQYKQFTNKQVAEAVHQNTHRPVEPQTNTQKIEDISEEQFYLEPIE